MWVVVSIMGIGLAAGVGDRPIAVVAEDAIEVEPDIEIVDGPVPVPFARPAIARTNSGSTSDLPGAELKTNPENDRLLDRAEKFVERGRFDLASVLWQRVLDTSADSMMTHDDWVDQTVIQKHKYRRYRSVATEIESRLARLKPAALKTYRITADGEAKALLSAAGQERREEALARIVRRFFLSSLGDDAAYELACLALDRHDFVGAGRLLAKILEEYPDSSIPRDEVLLRFAVAQASVGDAQSATAALDEIDRLPNRSTTRAARQAVRAYLDERGPAAVASARRSWPMAFGSAERDGAMPALPSEQADQPLEPIWRLSFDPDKAAISGQTVKGKAFTYDPTDGLLSASGEINFALRSQLISRWKQAPGQVPTGHVLFDGGRIYHKTPKALFCFDAETGRMLWRSRSFTFAPDSLSPYFARFKGQINAAHIPSSTADRLLLLDRVNPGMAISDGRIYAITGALKDDPPMAGGGTQRRHYVSIPKRARHNRLTALDARTGKLLWRRTAHDPTPKPGEQLRRHVGFMGAPVPYGRLLLIPVTDNGTLWLYALDATTGGKVWKTYLCEEPSGGASPWSPVAVSVSGGDAYVSTGVGVVFAVGAMSGEVRWAVRYPRAGNMASGSRRSYPRVSGMLLKPGGFIADVVIPYGKALVVIPSDFDHLFAIDRRTGEFLWDSPLGVMGEVRSVIGASAGRLYLASHDVVRCIEMQTGRRVWGDTKEQKVGGILGRGCVTSDAVYVPVSSPEGGASGKFQTHLVRLSLEDGRELSRSPVTTPEGDPLGNLYCDGERVYAAALHRLYALGTADYRLNLLKDLADSGDTDAQESTLRILSRSGRYDQLVDRLLAQHAAELKKVSRPDDISPSTRLYRAAEEFDLVKHSPAAALRLLAAGHRQRPLTPDEEPARDLWELRGRILFAALRAAADEMAGDAADVRLERVLEVLPLCTQLHEQWAARSAALAAAGRQGAQGAKALRSLLDSGSATDRLVATALVELDKDSDAAEITPLADDKDHRVALAAGFAALKSGDRRGLDWLAGLLTAEEQLVRAQAAELLTAATGRSLGYSAFAEKIDRAAKAAAWKKWIEQNGAAVKLQPLRRPRR